MNSNRNRRALVNLASLAANYRYLSSLAAPASCAAVVKANAYGLGVHQVAKTLYEAGCENFFVATTDEALELRTELPDAEIFVFDGSETEDILLMQSAGVYPVLNNVEQAVRWSEAGKKGIRSRCILHLDTGMNRLGVDAKELADLCADQNMLKGLDIAYVMTHLACSDEPRHPRNRVQLERFNAMRAKLPPHKTSIASSSGVFLDKEFHGDLVRAGISLFGGNPDAAHENPMREVIKVQGRIIQIREILQADAVGYGATASVEPPSRLATVEFGYADGYPRALSNRAHAMVGIYQAPVVGRVSMDYLVLDISAIPPDQIRKGAWATLIGDGIDLDELAATAGSINYELLTRLGPRVKRLYIE